MSNTIDLDNESRKKIVEDIDFNFFVEAGAGSGKTTMLVNRMVAMVEAGIPIEKICAITFTKAAAGEFYNRFQKKLIERSSSSERSAEALKNIDLCFMGTIDSFCSMILSEHPSEAQIPSDACIVSDQDAENFYKQEYVKICSGEYGGELADLAHSFQMFYWDAEQVFVQGVSLLMNNRNVRFDYTPLFTTNIDAEFAEERKQVIKVANCLAKHPELKKDGNKACVAAWEKIEDISKALQTEWSQNFSSVMYTLKELKKIILEPKAEIPSDLVGLFNREKPRSHSLTFTLLTNGDLLPRLQNICYSISMTFLSKCVLVLEKAMRDAGKMTFFDYLYYLRNMLRKDAEGDGKLIRHISERHKYFLIDEFQDTNPMQAEIFFYLASEHPVAQWSACKLRPGSLFIVGDPKQSIYRFRSADVASFLKVKKLFEQDGCAVLSLSRNFRSTKMMCDYFNRVLSKLLPAETPDQSKFEEIPPSDKISEGFNGIYTYTAYTGKLEAEHPEETDPVQIAKIIDRLVDGDKIHYSDIMVITSAKANLGSIMATLKDKNIPIKVEGAVSFGTTDALLEISKIFSAVADADDAISLYGALTGKIFGLTEQEILKFKEYNGCLSLKSSLSSERPDNTAILVTSKIEELKKLRKEALGLSPAALFVKIMDDYKVYDFVKTDNLEVVYYSLELMRNAERSGLVISLKDGAKYLSKLINSESGEERCLSLNDNRDAVHIANLHKVKGLEAPIVILAASAPKKKYTNDIRVVHGDEGSNGVVFGLSKKSTNGESKGKYFETNSFENELYAEKSAGQAEVNRLIYVAATRAKNALIICDRIQASSNGGETHSSMWKPIMEADAQDFFSQTEESARIPVERVEVDSASLYAQADEDCVLKNRQSENATYSIQTPSHLHSPSKISEAADSRTVEEMSDTEEATEEANVSVVHKFPTILGTMTHKLMEMLVSAKNLIDASGAVDEIVSEFITPECEAFSSDFKVALSNVAERMRNGGYAQNNGLPQDMLKTLLEADEVYCEVPFCYSEEAENGKAVWNGIMDVVYLANGAWHIVDYKTNADGNDLDEKYKLQLEAYIKAFKTTTGNDADAYTYHIDI